MHNISVKTYEHVATTCCIQRFTRFNYMQQQTIFTILSHTACNNSCCPLHKPDIKLQHILSVSQKTNVNDLQECPGHFGLDEQVASVS